MSTVKQPSNLATLALLTFVVLGSVVLLLALANTKVANVKAVSDQNYHQSSGAISTPTPSPTADCGLRWRVVPSPNGWASSNNLLRGVAMLSGTDGWAVGNTRCDGIPCTLTEHWNGTEWSIVPSPNMPGDNLLTNADALSPSEVWAVGFYIPVGGPRQTLVQRWKGSEWSIVPGPDALTRTHLLDVDILSANDIWAVGYYTESVGGVGVHRTLAMHWDGVEWSITPTPNPGEVSQNKELWGVSALAPDDVWAVGHYCCVTGNDHQTLTLHWDGTQWSHIYSPNPIFQRSHYLEGVAAISSDDVWAVGNTDGGRVLILHWNGSEWSVEVAQSVVSGDTLYGVAAVSANDVWAVGYSCCTPEGALVMHWDGAKWSVVPSPNPGRYSNILYNASAVSSQDVWAVGRYWNGGPFLTLVERYHDPCAGLTPTPIPTPTTNTTPTTEPTSTPPPTGTSPATSTSTPTSTGTQAVATHTIVPTATAPATPTPCTITFTDVLSNNTFYEAIRCLACRGIISGYADGTFRPNNQVTRGQLAKIVSNAAGFTEPPTQQTFEDVPPTNTFYEWIERLTIRGYMTGYNCGSVGEPCITGKPYFRPFANATRGQTAKIVSNAAGFTEPPSGQTFEDVSPSHTFYEFIQRLATRNVMGGYPCGGSNEPCITGRPYFRPGNDVTRGQSSKIVANAFFPDCVTP